MEMTKINNIHVLDRFMVNEYEPIYNLFAGFVECTMMENRAVDFSKCAIDYQDGSIDFAELVGENGEEISFTELVCGKNGDEQYKKSVETIIKAPSAVLRELCKDVSWKEFHKAELLLIAHLYWLWSLGMSGVKTSCGKFGKLAGVKEQWAENVEDYNVNQGLWFAHVSAVGLKKELLLIYSILHRFLTWPNKPEFQDVDQVKSAMIDFIFKTRIDLDAPIRNGLLHLCDPDMYINLYSYELKLDYIASHSSFLQNYRAEGYTTLQAQDSVYYSKRIGKVDDNNVYRADRTEDKIRFIFDRMCEND